MLIRKQILLDPGTSHELEDLSLVANQSVSELIRRLLPPQINKEKKKYKSAKPINTAKLMLEMAKRAEKIAKKYGCSYPGDLSINHDHYLYGTPKKNV